MSQTYTLVPVYVPDGVLQKQRRRAAGAKYRARLLDFQYTIKKSGGKTVAITETPCMCKRNHFSIALNDTFLCPVIFWLNMCQLMRLRSGDRAMIEWADSHPPKNYIQRINKEADATFEEDDEDNS